MKSFIGLTTLAGLALAVPVPQADEGATGGSGPYSARYTTDDSLPEHTIYVPVDTPEAAMPVLVWGQGACSGNGAANAEILLEIASHGFLVIASGAPFGEGSTVAQQMTDSIIWAASESASAFGNVDGTSVAAAGTSCGGLEAYEQNDQENIRSLGIFNSGFYDAGPEIDAITKPTFYFVGGPADIAYENSVRDYAALTGVPKWIGNVEVGHGGTFMEPNGGAYGKAAVAWLQWTLQGSAEGAEYFESGLEADGWTGVESEGLEGLAIGGAPGDVGRSSPTGATTPAVGASSPSPTEIVAPGSSMPAADASPSATGGMGDCGVVYVEV